jgi:Icc-related predicted phosphoesterase
MVIHSGDATNHPHPHKNEREMRDFITWFDRLNIKHKVFVPGNHDTSIEYSYVTHSEFQNLGIHLLVDELVELDGIKIYGSPWCPQWGTWSYMLPRQTLYDKVWNKMPDEVDVLVTHTPAMGTLDLTYHSPPQGGPSVGYENVGCEDLGRRVREVKPKLHCFGHIHSFRMTAAKHAHVVNNNGVRTNSNSPTVSSNAATNLHGSFGQVWCAGNVIDWSFVDNYHKTMQEHT